MAIKQMLNGRVLIFPNKVEEKVTVSGLVLPADKRDATIIGKVVLCDPALAVSVGDVVVFTKFASDEIDIDGEKYLAVSINQILAKYE